MRIEDLRIGNFLNRYYSTGSITDGIYLYTVDELMFGSVNNEGEPIITEMLPIPLTEEWLIRLGSEKKEDNVYKIGLLYFWWDGKELKLIISGTVYHFVHEIQNVHFCLTGKELEIKQ